MRRVNRALHTFGRYRHSRGFGIHSPFAFRFILHTLREHTPYYVYPELTQQRRTIKRLTGTHHLMPEKHIRMLFRIVSHFQPKGVTELGSLQGEELSPVLEPCRDTVLSIYAPAAELPPFISDIYQDRIRINRNLPADITDSFVVMGNIDDSLLLQSEDLLRRALQTIGDRNMTIIFPHIRSNAIRRLWNEVKTDMPYGMTFYNEKSFAVAIVNHKLPRQDFRVSL